MLFSLSLIALKALPVLVPGGFASDRDRNRIWPQEQLDAFSQSGLWSINVPKEYSGPGLSNVTLNRVIAIISEADPCLGQVPQNHLGVARAARADTRHFVLHRSRAWVDSGLDSGLVHASHDPYTIQAVGDLNLRANAAAALLDIASVAIDAAVANPTVETVAQAQISTAEAKVLSTEIAILATNELFELAGTRSTLAEHNLDRHWRNARTHTLHDPVRWKYAILGNYYLNGVNPPFHAWI